MNLAAQTEVDFLLALRTLGHLVMVDEASNQTNETIFLERQTSARNIQQTKTELLHEH